VTRIALLEMENVNTVLFAAGTSANEEISLAANQKKSAELMCRPYIKEEVGVS
jgi:hypothetical protein